MLNSRVVFISNIQVILNKRAFFIFNTPECFHTHTETTTQMWHRDSELDNETNILGEVIALVEKGLQNVKAIIREA